MSYTFNKLRVGQRLTFYGYNEAGDEHEYDAIVESIDREAGDLVIVIDDPEAKPTSKPDDFRITFHRDEVDKAYDPLFGKPRRSNKLTLEPSYLYALVFVRDGKECGRAETPDLGFAGRLAAALPPTLPAGVSSVKRSRRDGTSRWLDGWAVEVEEVNHG